MHPIQGTSYPQNNPGPFLPIIDPPKVVDPYNYSNLLECLEKTLEKNIRLRESLVKKAESLRKINGCDTLTSEDRLLYNSIVELCEQTERIQTIINKQFTRTDEKVPLPFAPVSAHAPPPPPKKLIRITSPSLSASSSQLQTMAPSISQTAAMILKDYFVGKAKWETYFEDVGNEPSLPSNISEILESPCPIWKGEKVKNTHSLILVTATMNQRPYVLRNFDDFIRDRKAGYEAKIILPQSIKYNSDPIQQSYWLLITRKEILDCHDVSYSKQKTFVEGLKNMQGMRYSVPSLLEMATFALAHCVSTGKELQEGAGYLTVRCADKYGKHQLILVNHSDSTTFVVLTDKSKILYTERNVSDRLFRYEPERYLLSFGVRAAIRLSSS